MRSDMILEVKKTSTLSQGVATTQDSSDVNCELLTELEFDDQVDRVTGAIELFDSNLMDGQNLKEGDLTDDVELKIQVSEKVC